jgi:hypothetical protein
LPSVAAWLEVQNLTPFTITLDRIFGDFSCGGRIATFAWLHRATLKPATNSQIHVEGAMSEAQLKHFIRNRSVGADVRLIISASLVCDLGAFSIRDRHITSKNIEILNLQSASS